jgi:putative FmdB family regulatory protein
MPTYGYVCKDCKTQSDFIRPMKDRDNEAICINCTGLMERDKFSASVKIFYPQRNKDRYS